MLVAISLEHNRDHDDGPALPREGCNGCRMIEFAWQEHERANALARYAWHKSDCRVKFQFYPAQCTCGYEAASRATAR